MKSRHEIPLADRATGRTLQALSTLGNVLPSIRNLVMGDDRTSYRWRLAATHADDVDWQIFKGNQWSGRVPKHYAQGVILGANRQDYALEFNELRAQGSRISCAAAYALGKAVMTVNIPEHLVLARTAVDAAPNELPEGQVQVQWGLGRGDAYFALGFSDASDKTFTAFERVERVEGPAGVADLNAAYPDAIRV